jgi:UDP-N-acetylglucosamine--N-acetylmuramyl-(pentapeptide) pyrophosphoryl-undecaprenol N-acetylglucosamine transferase
MMSDTSLRIVIAGGGTGGHLFRASPAIRPAARCGGVVRGTARHRARAVPAASRWTIRGLGRASRLRSGGTLPLSAVDAMGVIARRRPHVVIGVGGYSSGRLPSPRGAAAGAAARAERPARTHQPSVSRAPSP